MSTLDRISAALKKAFKGNADKQPRIMSHLKSLQGNIYNEYAASQILKDHKPGYLSHKSKLGLLVATARKVEKSLATIDLSYAGGIEQLYDTYYLNTDPIPAEDGSGRDLDESARPLLEAIYADFRKIHAELTYNDNVWATEFPLTRKLVDKIIARQGRIWRGGWVIGNVSKENQVIIKWYQACRWVEPKATGPRTEVLTASVILHEAPMILMGGN